MSKEDVPVRIASAPRRARSIGAPVAASPKMASAVGTRPSVRVAAGNAGLRMRGSRLARPNAAQAVKRSVASPQQVSASVRCVKLRPWRALYASGGKLTAPEAAAKKASKNIRVAMAPSVGRGADPKAISESVSPVPGKDTKAKLEKRVVPASGKVRLRDLIGTLGGVVFWDAESRTVTAYTSHLTIQFKIGSNMALVNGKAMRLSAPPSIIGGRTVIDAKVYHEAVAYVRNVEATS